MATQIMYRISFKVAELPKFSPGWVWK